MKTVKRIRLRQVREGQLKFAGDRINKPTDVYDAVKSYYNGADREILSVLCLDAQNQPVCFNVASIGSQNTTRTRPAEILKVAIVTNASGLILIHNHPSGCLEPSPEDLEFTRAMQRASELVGVELYDHLVFADDGFTSLRERGLL